MVKNSEGGWHDEKFTKDKSWCVCACKCGGLCHWAADSRRSQMGWDVQIYVGHWQQSEKWGAGAGGANRPWDLHRDHAIFYYCLLSLILAFWDALMEGVVPPRSYALQKTESKRRIQKESTLMMEWCQTPEPLFRGDRSPCLASPPYHLDYDLYGTGCSPREEQEFLCYSRFIIHSVFNSANHAVHKWQTRHILTWEQDSSSPSNKEPQKC